MRQILIQLSLFMDKNGDGCFPSVETLENETHLSHPTVCHHLEAAEVLGWFVTRVIGPEEARKKAREKPGHKDDGRGWRNHHYLPKIPHMVVKEVNHHNQIVNAIVVKEVNHHNQMVVKFMRNGGKKTMKWWLRSLT